MLHAAVLASRLDEARHRLGRSDALERSIAEERGRQEEHTRFAMFPLDRQSEVQDLRSHLRATREAQDDFERRAAQTVTQVQQLESELVIQADQVAAITRDLEGKYHVHTSHGGASAGAGAWWGGFWGMLFGLLFFIPFAGLAIGAGMGALFGHFGEKGIDKAFQQQVRDYLKPGTSALFMVIEQATPDKAIAALQQYGGTVIRTSLSEEDTKKLQDALQPPAPVS